MTRTVVGSSLWEGRAVVTTALALLFLLPMATTAQQLCLCQPSTYNLTLNFNGTCMDQTVMMPNDTMAVAEVACVVQNGVPPLVDPIPVSVSNILISELDQQQQIVRQENNTGTFANGDVVAYESILSLTNPGMFDNVTTPSGLLIMITGVNEGGVVIENTFVILFSNLCNVYPVLEAGHQIGWIIFTAVTPPPGGDTCPLAPLPSDMPSDVPSDMPSDSPSDIPSMVTLAPVTLAPVVPPPTPVVPPTPVAPTPTDPPVCVEKGKGKKKSKKTKSKSKSSSSKSSKTKTSKAPKQKGKGKKTKTTQSSKFDKLSKEECKSPKGKGKSDMSSSKGKGKEKSDKRSSSKSKKKSSDKRSKSSSRRFWF